jgi:hypothetical protein
MGAGRGKSRRALSGAAYTFTVEQEQLLREHVDLLLLTGEAAGLRGYTPTKEDLLEEKEYQFSQFPSDEATRRLKNLVAYHENVIVEAKARGTWNPRPLHTEAGVLFDEHSDHLPTDETEERIRARFHEGEEVASLASEYGLGTRTVQRIVGDLKGDDLSDRRRRAEDRDGTAATPEQA